MILHSVLTRDLFLFLNNLPDLAGFFFFPGDRVFGHVCDFPLRNYNLCWLQGILPHLLQLPQLQDQIQSRPRMGDKQNGELQQVFLRFSGRRVHFHSAQKTFSLTVSCSRTCSPVLKACCLLHPCVCQGFSSSCASSLV